MVAEFDEGTDPSLSEEVERRAEPRGLLHGMTVDFPKGDSAKVLEASRKGFFVALDEPERFLLGEMLDLTVRTDQEQFTCRVEVVRKEIHPRSGAAFRVVHMAPVAEETLKRILERA